MKIIESLSVFCPLLDLTTDWRCWKLWLQFAHTRNNSWRMRVNNSAAVSRPSILPFRKIYYRYKFRHWYQFASQSMSPLTRFLLYVLYLSTVRTVQLMLLCSYACIMLFVSLICLKGPKSLINSGCHCTGDCPTELPSTETVLKLMVRCSFRIHHCMHHHYSLVL